MTCVISVILLATSAVSSPLDGAKWMFPAAVERTAKNTTLEFRHAFTCAEGAKPQLAIAADTVYRVDLNGGFVHTGRFPDVPPERFYDVLDLRDAKAGRNELVVSLYVQGVDSYQTIPGDPGVAFRVFGEGVSEDESGEWRRVTADVAADVPRLTYQLGYAFVQDATAKASAWTKLTAKDVVRAASDYRLELRPVPRVETRPEIAAKTVAVGRLDGSPVPEAMKMASAMDATKMTSVPLEKFYVADGNSVNADLFDDGFYCIVDLGREETGFVSLDVDTDAGAVLDIGYAEHMENGRLKVSLGGYGFCGRYLARDGRQSWWCWRRRIAGRYLQLHVRGARTHFRLNRLSLKPAELPVRRLPPPQVADVRLRSIREVGVRTLELCMHEHYEDCPWREQALYANDARNQMLAGYYAFGTEWPMPRLALRLFSRGFDARGWQEMCMPAKIEDFSIPSFAMCWALSVGDYLEQAGDVSFVREMMPYMRAFLDRRVSELADGLLPCPTGGKYWHFYEWTEGMANWGVRLKDGERVFLAPLNLMLVLALESGAKCADACGDEPSAAKWRRAAAVMRPAIAAKFWQASRREVRTYSDGRDHACELVQALALLAEAVPESERPDLARRLAQSCEGAKGAPCETGWVKCSLSQLLYKYVALIAAGYGREVVAEMTAKWWRMIEAGATSFWETERGWRDFDGAGSLCHGWSSVPVYLMGRHPDLFSDSNRAPRNATAHTRQTASPSSGRHPVIAGRDFHCFGTSLAPGCKYAPPKTNSFDGMSCEYRIYPQMSGDGRWVHDLSSLKPLKADDGTVRPFTINYYPRIPCRPNVFLTGKLDPRQDDYDRFKAREPNFVGFVTLEWVNDAVNPLGGGQNLVKNRRKQYSITEVELAEVCARDEYVHCYDDRDQFTTNLLKKTFNRIVEVCQGDPKKLWIGEGSFCADHLCADWGAGGIAFETSRNYCFWQIQMMFARGAARQYGLPWYWYVASFFLGYNSDGKWSGQGNQCADTPDRGISRSAVRRVSYLSWLAGASCYQREGIEHAFYKPGTQELSAEGEIYDEFWNFTQTHRRGVPYQPVALLVPFNRGYTRAGGLAYKRFAYTHADKMLDVVMSTILEWPKNGDRAAARKGAERVLANSKYGDMFDVLVPNASRRSFFRLALKNYPVAVLIGDYGDDAEMSDALREYVSGGGKLVVNSAQMTPSMSWARGETSVRRVGKGTVIVTEEPYWCPWTDGEGPETGVNIMGVTKSYPEVAKTFDDLLAQLYPVRVTGEVQYGFNRLTDGWQVYLINNGGVTKFGDKAESFDSKGVEVTLDCSELGSIRIVEQMTGKTLTPDRGVVRLTVSSGDLRIIDILQ